MLSTGCGCRLKAVEVGADFGVGPVGVADDFASDYALAIDDVGFGPSFSVVELGGGLIGVADGDQVDMAAGDETGVGVGVFVDADGEDGQVGAVVVKLDQARHLLNAGGALRPPEVEQDDFAAIAGQVDGGCAVGYGEVGRSLAGEVGMCAAVARGGKSERQKKNGEEETTVPHVSIIRSERAIRHGEGWAG